MELSQLIAPEVLTDTVLNLIGYVTAGALCTMAYSAATGKKRPTKAITTPSHSDTRTESARSGSAQRKTEFVSLKSVSTGTGAASTASRGLTLQQQRNRAEVIRLAREMLISGTSRDNVRSLLPISDGELAMLTDKQSS